MSRLIIFIIASCLLMSCYSELDLDIPVHDPQIVVEGWIEQGQSPNVILTRTAPFFTTIDSSNILDFAISTAKVEVMGGNEKEILIYRPYNIYFPPFIYFGLSLKGKVDHTYNLVVISRGDTIRAQTSIPKPVEADSVWFYKLPDSDTLGLLRLRIKDNALEKNYYRTLVKRKRNDAKFIPTLVSVFDDAFFNGDTITINLSQGLETLLEVGKEKYFHTRDTIILKFCTIDETTFKFWQAISTETLTAANQFSATNTSVEGNIEGGIGIWAGYGVTYDTVYYVP